VLAVSTSSSSTPPREDPFFPPRHNSWADEKEENIEMEEAVQAATASGTAQTQAPLDEEESAASETKAQAKADEEMLASDGDTEVNGKEDAKWQIVGKPRSPQPIFGKFKEWDGGVHAPEASEEEEEEEGPGASQIDGMIEQEDVKGSATASTNGGVMGQDEMEEPSNTSTGIDGSEEEEVEDAPVNASTE
jgi:hypothetical protein